MSVLKTFRRGRPSVTEKLELSTFEPCVGDGFRLEFADHPPVDLTLVEAAPGPWQPAEGPTAFRLEFSGPPDPVLEQRTYRMTHDGLGNLDIFIVPIARTDEKTTYEAIFN